MHKTLSLYSYRIDHFKTFKIVKSFKRHELLKKGKGGSKPRLRIEIGKRAIVPASKKQKKRSIVKDNYVDFAMLGIFSVCTFSGLLKLIRKQSRERTKTWNRDSPD